MLISKFDVRRSEWLELVFVNRNKEYGAYYLRQHAADNTVKAMGITFLSITAAIITGSILFKPNVIAIQPPLHSTIVEITAVKPVTPPKKEEAIKPAASKPIQTTKYVAFVATNDPVTETPPDVTKITGAVGQKTVDVPGEIDVPVINIPNPGPGTVETAKPDNTVHTMIGLDVMPEPDGGAAGWSKFLNKNLRYPGQASEAGISGKVWVSFVVEKDGQISNVTVEKGAGYGMDEEALRVLKMSKKWKPGMQNGQPVRVKYTLPLNFVLSQE